MEIIKKIDKLHKVVTGEELVSVIVKKGDQEALIGKTTNPFEMIKLEEKALELINGIKN